MASKRVQPPAPLVSDLRAATRELSDVTLSSDVDGGSVPASRFLLGARSRVFKSMLLGRFAEADRSTISLPYETEVLESLVHYCATDDILTFEYLSDEDEVRVVVGIVAAAHFYELPILEGLARRYVCSVMEDRPPLSCVVLEQTAPGGGEGTVGSMISAAASASAASLGRGPSGDPESTAAVAGASESAAAAAAAASESSSSSSSGSGSGGSDFCGPAASLRRRAMDVIRYRTREALLPVDRTHGRGVALLSAASLREVVSDELIHADEATLFRCVHRWADAGGGGGGGGSDGKPSSSAAASAAASSSRPSPCRPSPRKRLREEEGAAVGGIGQDRVQVARTLVSRCIRLSRIPPSELRRLVKDSGLVSKADIAGAFEAQAIRAELRGHVFSEPRSTVHRRGRVVVRGAGVAACNGEYYPAGTCDEVPKYERPGKYQGEDATFTMFRFRSDDGTRRWYISIVPTNHEPGEDDHDFYYSDCDFDTPFGRTWKKKEDGVDPAPECTWEPDDFDDDLPLRI